MVVTEAMLVSMEELQRHAGDMENHVKTMMEEEGRRHGMELDRRRNARELWNELNKHLANCEGHEPEHTHADGTTHAHAGGDMPHEHDEDGAIVVDEDDMVMEAVEEAAAMPDDGVMEVEDDTDSNEKS